MSTEIIESFNCIYEKSYDNEGQLHSTTNWREKYRLLRGRIWIIRKNEKQYFQWNPYQCGSEEIIVNKGMVSSNDEFFVKGNKLVINTLNSEYFFRIINRLDNSEAPSIMW